MEVYIIENECAHISLSLKCFVGIYVLYQKSTTVKRWDVILLIVYRPYPINKEAEVEYELEYRDIGPSSVFAKVNLQENKRAKSARGCTYFVHEHAFPDV